MAKSNSYKKLIAGTMTAAMVAGVVSPVAAAGKTFPDVPSDHWAAESIYYLADKGAIKGKPDGTYGPAEAIDRASAATIFAQLLELPIDDNAQPSFKDAKNTWAAKYIAAVEKAGVIVGDGKDNFYPEGKIDRASFASMLVSAYNLKEKVNGTLVTTFDDLRGHWGEEKANILINLGISVGTGKAWEPNKSVTRAEAAQFIAKTHSQYAKPDNSVAKVTDVSVSGPAQLTLTGTGLNNLAAEDVTLEGNKAIAIEASKDGKTATVTLGGKVAPNKDLTVNVKDESFNVKYVYEVKKLRVEALTFDDDRADQAVVFKLNEEKGNADIEYLDLAGYDVKFVANKLDGTPATIFEGKDGNTAESKTGKLAVGINEGKYKVEVQVTKRGGITISNTGTIEVKNLDAEATAIKDVVFAVDTDGDGVKYNSALAGQDFALNSKTLVAGEKAGINKVVAQINKENKVVDSSAISVKSSNPGVISVVNNKIKAEAAGSATLTVKVGDVTKTFNFVVKTDPRKLTTVKATPDQLKVVEGRELPVTFVTTDQYGDPFAAKGKEDGDSIKEVLPQSGVVEKLDVATDKEGSIGTSVINVKGDKVGTGTIHFQNPNKNASGEGYGSLLVEVTKSNIGHEAPRLELVSKAGQKDQAADTTLGAGNTVAYQLSNYTTEGVYADAADLVDKEGKALYDFRVGNDDIAKAEFSKDKKSLIVTGKQAGVTDVILTKDGATAGHATITVTQENIQITSVKFKDVEVEQFENRKVDIDRVLDVVKSDKDDVVNGIKLNINTEHKVRIIDAEGPEQGKLYLDRNDNAKFDDGDVALGYVTAVKSSDTVSKEGNDLAKFLTDETKDKKNDVFKGVTTAFGDKGTVIFKVVNNRFVPTTEYGTKAVTINVIKEEI